MADKTLAEVSASGSKREILEALRDFLADSIDKATQDRDIAALTNRFLQVLEELDQLPDDKPESKVAGAAAQSKSRRAKK